MSGNNNRGFTLIELMITVAIIAIIAAIAFPSYQDSVQKTRRADGKAALESAAAMQERWFTENNSYTSVVANIGGTTSSEGFYTIAVTNVGCVTGTYISCFDLTATAVAPQDSDTHCATFNLDETGTRGATNTDCW